MKNYRRCRRIAIVGVATGSITLLASIYFIFTGGQNSRVWTVADYREAAESGDADAQYNLGWMYDNGEGVVEDDKEAVKWYQKAADQGDAQAQSNLGFMYEKGQGVGQNNVTAYAWLNIAAANDNSFAKNNKPVVAKGMTPAQIAKAGELVKEMVKKHPKLIKK